MALKLNVARRYVFAGSTGSPLIFRSLSLPSFAPARVTRFERPDVKAIRAKVHMKQDDFASLIGVSSSLVQSWEQGLRTPAGAALKLLRVIERKPEFVQELREA